MASYIVELYWPDMREADVRRMLIRVERAVRLLATEGVVVEYLGSTLVLGDEACYLRFEGPSPASIAHVCERAEVVPGRILEAVDLGSSASGG